MSSRLCPSTSSPSRQSGFRSFSVLVLLRDRDRIFGRDFVEHRPGGGRSRRRRARRPPGPRRWLLRDQIPISTWSSHAHAGRCRPAPGAGGRHGPEQADGTIPFIPDLGGGPRPGQGASGRLGLAACAAGGSAAALRRLTPPAAIVTPSAGPPPVRVRGEAPMVSRPEGACGGGRVRRQRRWRFPRSAMRSVRSLHGPPDGASRPGPARWRTAPSASSCPLMARSRRPVDPHRDICRAGAVEQAGGCAGSATRREGGTSPSDLREVRGRGGRGPDRPPLVLA